MGVEAASELCRRGCALGGIVVGYSERAISAADLDLTTVLRDGDTIIEALSNA